MPERVKQLQEKQKRERAEYQAKQKAYWDAVKKNQEQLNKKIQDGYDGAVDKIGLKTSPESSPSPPQSQSSPPPVQNTSKLQVQSSKQPNTSNFNPTPAPINSGQGSFVVLKTGGQTIPAFASPPPAQKNYQPPGQNSKQPSTSNFNPTPAPINSGQGSFVVLKTGGQTTPALASPPSYTAPPVQKTSKP
jgi:hypothetical protein